VQRLWLRSCQRRHLENLHIAGPARKLIANNPSSFTVASPLLNRHSTRYWCRRAMGICHCHRWSPVVCLCCRGFICYHFSEIRPLLPLGCKDNRPLPGPERANVIANCPFLAPCSLDTEVSLRLLVRDLKPPFYSFFATGTDLPLLQLGSTKCGGENREVHAASPPKGIMRKEREREKRNLERPHHRARMKIVSHAIYGTM